MADSASTTELHPNYEFVLRWAAGFKGQHGKPRILDYGCGDGTTVTAGRSRGLDIVGVELFYEGSTARDAVTARGLLGSAVFELVDGRIPFADGSFDLIVSNQVFEHVKDLDGVLDEISRVLVPGGCLLALFPTREVLREGHLGVPLVHWFRGPSPARYAYTLALRSLGLGYYKHNKRSRDWTRDALAWLDEYTVYRSRGVTMHAFEARFDVEQAEYEYLRFRLARSGVLGRFADLRLIRRLGRYVVTALSGRVLIARKKSVV